MFAVDLQMLLICRLKVNLPSKWIRKSSINGTDLIVWLSIANRIFVRLNFFLPTIMTWNLSGLIFISFFVMWLSDFNVSINLETVSSLTDRVLLPQWRKVNHFERLNKVGPTVEPSGTNRNNFAIVAISIIYLYILFSSLR